MSDQISNSESGAGLDNVGRLIQHVGAREAVPAERLQRARQNVQLHWQQVVAAQQPARRAARLRVFAVAAGVTIALGISLVLWNPLYQPDVNTLASVERVLGQATIGDIVAGPGRVIGADAQISTGPGGRIALRMAGGQSLRIDQSSRVIVHSPGHVSLQSGALYIDTGLAPDAGPIQVSTPLGSAVDIGTQFQVRLTAAAMLVGVREGQVEVAQQGQQSISVGQGFYLQLAGNGEHEKKILPREDPDWAWVDTIAPGFDIQDASLAQYLHWYASELGLSLVWADRASEVNAGQTVLSGSIAGASPEQSLEMVKLVAPFEHRLTDRELWVRVD